MNTSSKKGAAFLQALSDPPPVPKAAPMVRPQAANTQPAEAPPKKAANRSASSVSRSGLKHIGGYFDREDVEKIAILRARLGLDNTQLIRLAVDELYKQQQAKRAFGDA